MTAIIPVPAHILATRLYQAGCRIIDAIRNAGHEVYFAGGFARDLIIDRSIHDIDIATSARPDQIQKIFPRNRAIGKSFGVIQVDQDDISFDIATFRIDRDYRDGRHPENVEFATAQEDASRRDFTINGMFYDPATESVIDYVGGLTDIETRQIRAIGSAEQRFSEDHLRIMRAIRFASVLEFDIEPTTWNAIRRMAGQLTGISIERIREEMIRTLMEAPKPGQALELLHKAGILPVIFPEASAMIGVEQPPEFHPEGDVFTHTALMLDSMNERTPALIWSILLHDIGKPATFAIGTDKNGKPKIQFRGHAELGAEMAQEIMKRFRCSNDEIESVVAAVKNHMRFMSVQEMRSSTLRKWIGAATFPLELELHRIDCSSSHGSLDNHKFMLETQKKLSEEPVLPAPYINGRDLMAMEVEKGPAMGRILKIIYDEQLESRFSNREEALEWVKANLPSLLQSNPD
ncbi:MAG TPA: CCA tRNA nucleotidyltransferase [Kiritimatiellia bacterium]|nr:CCA tRNA nucleotidyltransferase [Kiritimatiellia bacterium]